MPRSTIVIAGWALAAAAVLVASTGWVRTHQRPANRAQMVAVDTGNSAGEATLLAADYDTGEFTQLPGTVAGSTDESSVLQVRLQRGALARFGLPVEQDRASEWVDVDFLVGVDGQPQAVRLHQETESEAVAQ